MLSIRWLAANFGTDFVKDGAASHLRTRWLAANCGTDFLKDGAASHVYVWIGRPVAHGSVNYA